MNTFFLNKQKQLTRTREDARSHSTSSLPPPELKRRKSDAENGASGLCVPGYRTAKAKESTFEGYGPDSVCNNSLMRKVLLWCQG
jgi:hypothetical protein